ncbi:hypothetical protein A3F27_00385 [Candidatus Kaiserbacteria bacterium RIFCSPHIGHO2_12_FULL_53_13]|uniref:M23ase beta-sheet core domain-containing protein n=1 Tax=Candidatus Kaiserbacteria bacterium RIFCSPHIGHO2_12_FULL_53_13 TaxID=1798502 RepID=A0A1F6E784_9BACT|nr:MAG: hypothetical protein A3F27_00385 [Candidatus Kaiserbacteria bacterium RIFCSPHIGHO2_12_FULL_53_13]OGG74418.1 MAG: hypothetical protein A3A37_02090 [Candidatus Kaiserbacteria bacterium RIFCSPLOWO2_01_FULL_52_36]
MKTYVRTYAAFLTFAVLISPLVAVAQSADELQKQIDSNTAQIAALEKEIAQYQVQLDATIKQKNTLQNTVAQLDLQRKKLTASINVTKSQINTTQLQIRQLSTSIANKQSSIQNNKEGLAESLRLLERGEQQPLSIAILSSDQISDAWQDADSMASLQESIREDIDRLSVEKQSLTDTKTAAETKRAQLLKQQQTLVTQQGSLDATRKAQNELLEQTKAQESNFQAILAQKQAAKASFESALQDLQTKFQYTVDPSKITPAGRGILHWPLDKVAVTQQFGDTSFARSGGYNGKGHNGIDLRAQIGTPVRAALTGTVIGTGDTGSVRGCYSYGRWILIQHGNGLDTLYAHLSQISASKGQSVGTGQLIGYSGQTGYATGPHLHFGVYVSSATQIMRLGDATKQKTPCANAIMPIAPLSGYLNPTNYF